MKFIRFWYESNSCWGYVENINDLIEKCEIQTGEYGGLNTVDEFLDRSKQNKNGILDFGTRIEHTGVKSLRKFLQENNINYAILYPRKDKLEKLNKIKNA